MINNKKIAVVIPCYKVERHIAAVIAAIPSTIDLIIPVDDCSPDETATIIQAMKNPKVILVKNCSNLGVGGAVVHGYQVAIKHESDIIVKIDGDNQMDLSLIHNFIEPLTLGIADYAKGNRFYWPDTLQRMPPIRLLGNSGLSFINKLTSGYWDLMDPTNGYTAITSSCARNIGLEKLEKTYFFESDMLFRLGLIRARIIDIPMRSKYGDEVSNLSVLDSLLSFPLKYAKRFMKRIIYSYFLRDFNAGSVFLSVGIPLLILGFTLGCLKWHRALTTNIQTPTGTLFLIALLLIFGIQFILSFIIFDIQNTPNSRVIK